MTTLAEVAIDAAVAATRRELVATHGAPLGSEGGAPQPFVVAGLGKLGGWLLYTSDAAAQRSSVDLGGRRIL